MQLKELPRKSPLNQSFHAQHIRAPHFMSVWHYHEQIELAYIEKGSGTKFIGDSITPFKPGTLAVLGSNLPHLWLSDKTYFEKSDESVESRLVFFSEKCFGADFFDIPEFKIIKRMLESAKRGFEIHGESRSKIIRSIKKIMQMADYERPIELLKVLKMICLEPEKTILSSQSFVTSYKKESSSRLDKVYEFVLNNFSREIALDDMADLINMNASSFSRFFRHKTNKTFTRFLNEVRVGYACKRFTETDRNIAEIAYECGFNNISNFNKQFKSIKGMTPSEYLLAHSMRNQSGFSGSAKPEMVH